MTELQRSHAELRAAVILAGKEIRKLNFGRANSPVLVFFAASCRSPAPSCGVCELRRGGAAAEHPASGFADLAVPVAPLAR